MTTAILDDLKQVYNRAWWALLLRGLLSLTVGGFIFARPLDSVAAFALVIAWWALFSGFVNIVHAFQLKRSEEHTSELQSHSDLVCRLLLEKKKKFQELLQYTTIDII